MRALQYKPIIPDDHEHKELIEREGLDKPFTAISIGVKEGQIALVPLDESNEANANLIASAPELLEALKELHKVTNIICGLDTVKRIIKESEGGDEILGKALDQAYNIIKKAVE